MPNKLLSPESNHFEEGQAVRPDLLSLSSNPEILPYFLCFNPNFPLTQLCSKRYKPQTR